MDQPETLLYQLLPDYCESDAATCLINVGTGPCFPLCSIPSSSNNIWKHLELRRPAAGPLAEERCPVPV